MEYITNEMLLEAIRKKQPKKTNFQRITASPEALASWLDEHAKFCEEIPCDECSVNKECWLKEKHDGNS